jgi:hypothetical protein
MRRKLAKEGRNDAKVFNDLAETPRFEIRVKHKSDAPMHLKSYQIDGRFHSFGTILRPLSPANQLRYAR